MDGIVHFVAAEHTRDSAVAACGATGRATMIFSVDPISCVEYPPGCYGAVYAPLERGAEMQFVRCLECFRELWRCWTMAPRMGGW